MTKIDKNILLQEIKLLISSTDKPLELNLKYIEYFELDELIEIRDILLDKKEQNKTPSKDYLDEIFNSCS
jgi:hypothetical protein